jgi:hypothetical protein
MLYELYSSAISCIKCPLPYPACSVATRAYTIVILYLGSMALSLLCGEVELREQSFLIGMFLQMPSRQKCISPTPWLCKCSLA